MTLQQESRDWYIGNLETKIAINIAAVRTIEELMSLRHDGLLTDEEYRNVWKRIGR